MTTEARNALVAASIGIAHNIAHNIARRFRSCAEYDDLVQIGCLALIEAAKNFDASKGASFSTFAGTVVTWRVRSHIRTITRRNRVARTDVELTDDSASYDAPDVDRLDLDDALATLDVDELDMLARRYAAWPVPFKTIARDLRCSKAFAITLHAAALEKAGRGLGR